MLVHMLKFFLCVDNQLFCIQVLAHGHTGVSPPMTIFSEIISQIIWIRERSSKL
jgi:hypothetical protein